MECAGRALFRLQCLYGVMQGQSSGQPGRIQSDRVLEGENRRAHSPGSKQAISAGAGKVRKMHRQYSSN